MKRGFTLIELLVVIAIIAVLAVVVVLTLNPGQLILQSRDSTRLSDLASLQSAVALYQTDRAINGTVSLGSSSIVYVSLPDPAATTTLGSNCASLGLPALPPAYTYHCAASSTFRKVDGSGWIPVNLSSISSGAPLGQLPIDPVNTSSSRSFLTYTTNGTQYEVTSQIESSKYKLGGANDVASLDGGNSVSLYEKGTNLTLQPLDYGDSSLVGYWTFDEGSGSIVYDYSGNNATGSWSGTQAGTSGYYSAGKVGMWAGTFDGTSTILQTSVSVNHNIGSGNFTLMAWIYLNSYSPGSATGPTILSNGSYIPYFGVQVGGSHALVFYWGGANAFNTPVALGTWNLAVLTRNGGVISAYLNGVREATTYSNSTYMNNTTMYWGESSSGGGDRTNGLVDDVRIYNRALSAAEVQALYNSSR